MASNSAAVEPPPYSEIVKKGEEEKVKKGEEEKVKKVEEEEEENERGAWGSQLEFILTCVGYAVGLGNVWRFPYLCFKNGGGAFLIPYVIMLAFVGLPIFYFELCVGQFSSLGPIAMWSCSPIFKGIGYGMVAVSWMIGLYYNVIIAWSIYFFFASMTSNLPWAECGQAWNTDRCILGSDVKVLNQNETLMNATLAALNMTSKTEFKTPSEEFFYNEVLKLSSGIDESGGVVWQLCLCLFLCWLIVFLVLIKGIESLGKVVYFVAIFPYLMMTAMMIRGVTLEGAGKGIEFYMKPDMSRLADATVWSDAATQIFYSLSACSGGLIAMASYNNFNNNVYRDSLLVPLINCFTSVYAGFAIFSVLGFMANEKGVDVADVADSGPGLVFVVYPEGLSQMPAPTVWAILFFFMLITLGFSSEFSIVEAVFIAIIDEFPQIFKKSKLRPIMFRGICIFIFFLITIPMTTRGGFYLFNMVDSYLSGFPLLFIGLFELTSVIYVYGFNRFKDDIFMMLGKKPDYYFQAMWMVISPALLLAVTIFKCVQYNEITWSTKTFTYVYPGWATALGWMIVAFTVIWIPIMAIYKMCLNGGFEVMKDTSKPLPEWGPHLKRHRTGVYAPPGAIPSVSAEVGKDNQAFEMTETV